MKNALIVLLAVVCLCVWPAEAQVAKKPWDFAPYFTFNQSSPSPDIFQWGEGGYAVFAIPAVVCTPQGVVIAFSEARQNSFDGTAAAIVQKRSYDKGITWTPLAVVVAESAPSDHEVGNPAPWVAPDGKVWLFFKRAAINVGGIAEQANQFYVTNSTDDGSSWACAGLLSGCTEVTNSGTVFGIPSTYFAASSGITVGNSGSLIKITKTAHNLQTDFLVTFTGFTGTDGSYINNSGTPWRITKVDNDNFTLDSSNKASVSATAGSYAAASQNELPAPGNLSPTSNGDVYLGVGKRYKRDKSASNNSAYAGVIKGTWVPATKSYTWSSSNLTQPASVDLIESRIVPTGVNSGAADSLYMSCRSNSASARAHYTFNGTSWSSSPTLDDGTGGTTLLPDPQVQCGLTRVDSSTWLLTHPEDTSDRTRMVARLSTNGGSTWAAGIRTMFYGLCGYSDSCILPDGSILTLFERSHRPGAYAGAGNSELYRSSLAACKVTKAAILNTAAPTLDSMMWHFNEVPTGGTILVDYPTIRDSNQTDWRLIPKGAPTAVAGYTSNSTAISLATSSDYVIGAQASRMALDPDHSPGSASGNINSGSFCWEFLVKTSDSDGVLIGGSASGRGYSCQIASGFAKLALNDGSGHTPIATGTTPVADGTWHRLMFRRDKPNSLIRVYVDGVLDASATDTTTTTISDYSQEKRFGQFNNGSSNLVCSIDWARYTVGLPSLSSPDSTLSKNLGEPARQATPAAPANDLASFQSSALKLYVGATHDPTATFTDYVFSQRTPSVLYSGVPINSVLDKSSLVRQVLCPEQTSPYASPRSPRWMVGDPIVGRYWDCTTANNGAVHSLFVPNSNGTATNNFDWIQGDGTGADNQFTFHAFLRFYDNATTNDGIILDNHDSTSGTSGSSNGCGITLSYARTDSTSGKIKLQVSGPVSTNRIVYTTTATVNVGLWYQVVIVGNGVVGSNALTWYLNPVTTAGVGTISTFTERGGNFTGSAGATNSTASVQNLQIGRRLISTTSTPGCFQYKYMGLWKYNGTTAADVTNFGTLYNK